MTNTAYIAALLHAHNIKTLNLYLYCEMSCPALQDKRMANVTGDCCLG